MLTRGQSTRPVEQLSAQLRAGEGQADDEPVNVHGRVLLLRLRPVRVRLPISGDRCHDLAAMLDDPGFLSVNMLQDPFIALDPVWPRLSPLIGLLCS